MLTRPKDATGLAMFRILFGLMMAVGLVRFMAQGWVEKTLEAPTYFFRYPGFEWIVTWPRWGLYLHFGIAIALALMIAAGLFYRFAVIAFFFAFLYIQLLDVTLYLNHYYLVLLLSGLMMFMPLGRTWSLDALRKPTTARETAPAWCLYLLRFQVAVVYLFAAIAKISSDWLLHGQPMNIWMSARVETPIIGPLLGNPETALFMSWFGFLYDLTIVGWLLYRPTRKFAYAVVILFHFFTFVFFEIGMFPIIMIVATTLFFSPDWPRRIFRRPEIDERSPPFALPAAAKLAIGAYVLVQVLVPLRTFAYPQDVLWAEEGMRFSWRVMVREKNGSVTYRVRRRGTQREWQVNPKDYLTWRQLSDMSAQPDLIAKLAKHIAADFDARGLGPVEVRVDAFVSLNGRPPSRIIDPRVDLNSVSLGLAPADWILPAPTDPPIRLAPRVATKSRP